MVRFASLSALCGSFLLLGCAPRFQQARTPAGNFCSDMPIVPAGDKPEQEYHRLGPVSSGPRCRTEAERLESLRRAACRAGADAVIEAASEEVRAANGAYATVASGTAVMWLRPTEATKRQPLGSYPKHAPAGAASPEGAPPANQAPASAATPAATPATEDEEAAVEPASETETTAPAATKATPKKKK